MNEAQVIERMTLITDNEPPEVAEPGEEPFDFPAALVPTQGATILGRRPRAVATMRRNHLNAQVGQRRIESVRIIGPVANEPMREVIYEAGVEGWCDERDLVRRSRSGTSGERKTKAVCHCLALPMSFVPLPRLVAPTHPPPFSPPRRCRQ
jgi:hypothetical protein